jgi:hypothetical protein
MTRERTQDDVLHDVIDDLRARLAEVEAENERLRADYEACGKAHAILAERLTKVRRSVGGG